MTEITFVGPVEGNEKMVEVHANGPRGGKIEWTVTFGLDNRVKCGYCYSPHTGYQPEHLIPLDIKDAARKEYMKP